MKQVSGEKNMADQRYQIVRCPHCNSADVTAFYQQKQKRQGLLAWCFKWSIFGLIKYFLDGSKRQKMIEENTYWSCNRCGATFQ